MSFGPYSVIYKGNLSQTETPASSLREACEIIDQSGLDPRYFMVRNNVTGDETRYEQISHYSTKREGAAR